MGHTDWPPRFTINQSSILELFTGETFYSSVDASIREAILNAIDAIGRRQMHGDEVAPKIAVTFDRQSRTVTVSDNGDGMGKSQVSALFSQIGTSAARLANEAANDQYTSIGEFGIGVLSYFLICERFEIHSRRADSEPLGLEFAREMLDATTPASVVEPRRSERGTDLILFVDTERHFDKTRASSLSDFVSLRVFGRE